MFNRSWFAALAFGLATSLFASFDCIAQEVEDAPRPAVIDQPNNPADAEGDKNRSKTKTGNFCGPSYTLNCGNRDQNARDGGDPEEKARANKDLIAQQSMASSTESMANWTIVMAFSSVLSVCAAALAAWFAYGAVRETRRIGEAQVRAYLSVDIPVRGDLEINPESIPEFAIRVKNVGQSPARAVHHIAFTEVLPRVLESPSDDLGLPYDNAPTPKVIIHVGDDPRFTVTNKIKWKEIIPLATEKDDNAFYIAGIIWYEDVFQRPRKRRFAFQLNLKKAITNTGKQVQVAEFFVANAHNDET